MISRRDVPVRADLRRQAENNLDVVRIVENLRLFSRERKWKLRWNGREKAQAAQKHELGLSAALTHAETEPPRTRSLVFASFALLRGLFHSGF